MRASVLVDRARPVTPSAPNVGAVTPKSPPAESFADYLDRLMAEAGFATAADLARASGTSESAISRWRGGNKSVRTAPASAPTIEGLRAVAPHLGVRLGDLMIRAGLATAAELGTVGSPPPPRAPLPAALQRIVSILLSPQTTEQDARTLLGAVDQTVDTWLTIINSRREPQMRRRPDVKR